MPAPRTVRRAPFIQWQAPLAWTTLTLTLHAKGAADFQMTGASRFPRHWVYDHAGQLVSKSGLIDFQDWYRKSFGKHTPWGEQESEAFVTVVETALERSLSRQLMSGAAKPKIMKIDAGTSIVRQGENRGRTSTSFSTVSPVSRSTANVSRSTARGRYSASGHSLRAAPARRRSLP